MSSIAQKAANFVAVSSVLRKKMAAQSASLQKQAAEATSKLPGVLDALLEQKVLASEAKEAAAKQLSTHAGALAALKEAADLIQELRGNQRGPGELGVGDHSKVADSRPVPEDNPFVGMRSSKKKLSDLHYEEALMR